jgi:hypothetical protein
VWSTLYKLKIELLYDLAIPLLDICPKESKLTVEIHNSQVMESAKVSIKRWAHNRVLFSLKKNEITLFSGKVWTSISCFLSCVEFKE